MEQSKGRQCLSSTVLLWRDTVVLEYFLSLLEVSTLHITTVSNLINAAHFTID